MMAHPKPMFILALLLLNTACPAAGATVMRVHKASIKPGGEVEMMQTESVSGLAGMFSDDHEAQAVTSKLLMLAEGTPSDDLLPFVQKLKNQIQPWHDGATAQVKAAIEEIASCTAGMEKGMRETEAKKDSCSAKSTSHTTHRTDESTKFTTKEHWKAEKAEKKETETTECNAFQEVKDEVRSATASYGGGDEEAFLDGVSRKFCDDLEPRYKKHKEQCTTAKAEHVRVSEIYETKNTAYTVQKTTSDTVQTEMDVTCCEYALATKNVCMSHDTCYEDKVAAYKALKGIVEAEEKGKKVEWRVYSRIECLLPVLGTDKAGKIEECRAMEHKTTHLDIEYPAIPEKSTCKVEQDFPGTEGFKNAHYASLPDNAKGKAVAMCTGMDTGSTIAVAQHVSPVDYSTWDLSGSVDFTLSAHIKTTAAAGTIVGKAFENGLWKNGGSGQGKMLFLRGGRPAFDIGWVGVVQCQTKVNDGLEHEIAVKYAKADGNKYQVMVDGDVCGSGLHAVPDHAATSITVGEAIGHAVHNGKANGDMSPDFQGEVTDVNYIKA